MTQRFTVSVGSEVLDDRVRFTAEIRVVRGHVSPQLRRVSPDEPSAEVMLPYEELVATLRHEPGEPFMVELSPPREGATPYDLSCEEFIDALRDAMKRLGGLP